MNDVDLQRIRKFYSEMEDYEIVHIATNDANGLRKEVVDIIEIEIEKRNLDKNLISGVVVQNKVFTDDELMKYAKILQKLICPVCFTKNGSLNGLYVKPKRSKSSVINKDNSIIIACKTCMKKESSNALFENLAVGFIRNPLSLINAGKSIKNFADDLKDKNPLELPNGALLEFTRRNIGRIEVYKDDTKFLHRLIKQL